MSRNGPDDATRRGTSQVEAIEGLLAYARTRSRWGGGALRNASQAVAMSRTLVGESAGKHTDLLARALRTTAGILLERGKATEALPMAQEAVALTRAIGGGPLVVSLHCLAGAFEALHRYSEAAEMLAEADQIPPADC
ncbi:hypothetical protein GCM10022419_018320 [Nonomuraea rosea]|uniref:Tetratricopeptide repeat protein n=2 Tax=Nonomuraea rosea TaxID=638574 RepID=A0ABP6VN80_9ACTN